MVQHDDGDTALFEQVRPAPAAIAMHDYSGTYTSDELDGRLVVAEKDGMLYVRRRPVDEFQLRPVYADDFASGGALGTLRFRRDASERVTGSSIYGGRVLDVRFDRQ